jgi:hypothetical protein
MRKVLALISMAVFSLGWFSNSVSEELDSDSKNMNIGIGIGSNAFPTPFSNYFLGTTDLYGVFEYKFNRKISAEIELNYGIGESKEFHEQTRVSQHTNYNEYGFNGGVSFLLIEAKDFSFRLGTALILQRFGGSAEVTAPNRENPAITTTSTYEIAPIQFMGMLFKISGENMLSSIIGIEGEIGTVVGSTQGEDEQQRYVPNAEPSKVTFENTGSAPPWFQWYKVVIKFYFGG